MINQDFYRINSFEAYKKVYTESVNNPETFWENIASTFQWQKKWDKVLEWDFDKPSIKWFVNGKLNITENCLDRHLEKRGEKSAIIWEPNNPEDKSIELTYNELYDRVCRYANVLKAHGIKKGDRIAIYMPMIPDLAIALLACARIGAIHSVVFAGFSARALSNRIIDCGAKMVLTSDGMYRGEKKIQLKQLIDDAVENCDTVETVLISKRTNENINIKVGRDFFLEDELKKVDSNCPAEQMDSEDPLYILYTSGSTGKPKGVVHSCGGYMVYVDYSFRNVFQYDEKDVYWCTADIGWVTGHSYIVYGPLLAGASTMMFEGIPTYPDPSRFWQLVDKHQVNQFYTAPTAIRSLMAHGNKYVESAKLDSLKVIGSVGEPINEEAWQWYYKYVGKEKCPIVDTWWQTETGGILLSGLGGHSPMKPSYAGYPLPGIQAVLLDGNGKEFNEPDKEGYLAIKFPWPSMIRTTWGDHNRCKETYFNVYPSYYFSGDSAKRDKDGMFRVIGRVDDVINVSGHRFGTAEIENSINQNKDVVESAVVGFPHPIKGQAIYAYVILRDEVSEDKSIKSDIEALVSKEIGKIARPDKIQFVKGLPKTRSGKIMRRILRKLAEGEMEALGDTSTLLNSEVIEGIKKGLV